MNIKKMCAGFIFLVAFICVHPEEAPQTTNPTTPQPVPYGPDEFPAWQKEVRRAEILSFGALPFVTFFSSIYYDLSRYYSHDGDERYLPWPFQKSEIAVPLEEEEQKKLFYTSVGISIGIAVFDFGYRALIREIKARKAERLQEETIEAISIIPIEREKSEETSPSGSDEINE